MIPKVTQNNRHTSVIHMTIGLRQATVTTGGNKAIYFVWKNHLTWCNKYCFIYEVLFRKCYTEIKLICMRSESIRSKNVNINRI